MSDFTDFGERIKSIITRIEETDINTLPEDAPDSRCPVCDGFGFVRAADGVRPCVCVRRETTKEGIEHARIPKRYTNATLDNFETNPTLLQALSSARRYVEDYSFDHAKGLYIYGGAGYGKTHLAIGILKALIARGFDGVFYNVVDLLDEIRSTFDPNNPTNPKSRLERDMNRQIFVLDDFGVQKTSAWVADRLYALINRRYQDCKTIILTSNIPLPELSVKIEDRLYSRMVEMMDPVEVKTGDFRRTIQMRSQEKRWKK